MKKLIVSVAAGLAALVSATALAQGPTERVRKLNLYSWPQAALPQSYQAAQLIAQQWRQLGLEVEVKPLQRQAQTQLIWFSRDKWDVTMWRMVGRPERSDPDEFLYSLYHSSYIEKGYNLVGYLNPEYDKLAEKQRTQLDRDERRKTAFAMQEIINRDQPNAFLVHPKYPLAFNKAVFKEDTVVNQSGIGIRNIWTFNIIFCGHFPTGVQTFTEAETAEETRGEWYVRQMLGSANISGSKLFHIMSGNLSHQIEHHLFPDLPANRYPQLAPEVRELCEKYGLPYNTGSLGKQVGSVWMKIFKLALPPFLVGKESTPGVIVMRQSVASGNTTEVGV